MRIKLKVPLDTYAFIAARRLGAEFDVSKQCWYVEDPKELGDWVQWLAPADRIRVKAQFAAANFLKRCSR